MDKVANLPPLQRSELFEQSAANRGIHPAIIEKDFWVCWVLKRLFESANLSSQLVFKGGTSLSKVYGLIDRFSEDIDLILDWTLLGYGQQQLDPWQPLDSNTQLDKFNREFNSRAAQCIASNILVELGKQLETCPEVTARVAIDDPQVIEVAYPASFKLAVLRPEVKLEIGPLASWVPSGKFAITPYAAEEFPSVFSAPSCNVIALKAERTFWEKLTILHQQAHRQTLIPTGYSRHYYDTYRLANSREGENAIRDLSLLHDVVAFKQRFYRSTWARYDLARPGTFKVLPSKEAQAHLQSDYRAMQSMFFVRPPAWEVIVDRLADLEAEINEL
jgi:hypothetical protein